MRDIQSERELEELGIVLKGHKRRIMAEIARLRERENPDISGMHDEAEQDQLEIDDEDEDEEDKRHSVRL